MRSVLEGNFQPSRHSDETPAPVADSDTSPTLDHDAANQVRLVPSDPVHEAPTEAVVFDVVELESQLERALPEKFAPDDYTEHDGVDRIIIGYKDGEPIYKAEPKPKPEPAARPPRRETVRRPSATANRRPADRPKRRVHSDNTDPRREYRSTHQLYQARHEQNPKEELGEFEQIDTFTYLNKWVSKATHIAAITTALLLILHYFPLPSG